MDKLDTMHFQNFKINTVPGFVLLCLLLILTVIPGEYNRNYTELIMFWNLPLLSIIALILVLAKKKHMRSYSQLDLLVFLWFAYCILSIWVRDNFPCKEIILKDGLLFLLYISLRNIFSSQKFNHIYISILIICLGLFESILGLLQICFGVDSSHLYVLCGSFSNPGPYSAYLMLSMIVAIINKSSIEDWLKCNTSLSHQFIYIIYTVTVSLLVISLLATWSRAAILSVIVVILVYKRHWWWQYRCYVLVGLVLLTYILYLLKPASACGRLLTWYASIISWSHAIFFGVGYGGFPSACANGISDLFALDNNHWLFSYGDVSQYSFCDFLKILVEQGVVGALLCICCVVYFLKFTYRWSKAIFYCFLSLFLFSLFSYPFEIFSYRLLIIIIASIIPHEKRFLIKKPKKRYIQFLFYFLIIIMSFVTVVISNKIDNSDKKYNSISSIHSNVTIEAYYSFIQDKKCDQKFLFDFAELLREKKRYNESNYILNQAILISNDPIFYIMMGNNYKDLGAYELSEKSYKKAFNIMPNRLYPIYQLMRLYVEQDNIKGQKRCASLILKMKPKIRSTATDKMTEEARKIYYDDIN